MSAPLHQLSLSLGPGVQRTGVPCVQFLSAFQIIANELDAPFPSALLQQYDCHLQAARSRALWKYFAIIQVFLLISTRKLSRTAISNAPRRPGSASNLALFCIQRQKRTCLQLENAEEDLRRR